MFTLTALLAVATGQRVWTLCKGPQFRPPTALEQANEVEAANSMCCTPEMTFPQLCCADFPNILASMTACGVVELAAAQQTAPGGGAILMQDDAVQPAEPIITVCTSASPVRAAAGGGAAIAPVECVKREFTIPEVTGVAPVAPMVLTSGNATQLPGSTPAPLPGEVVLDERIKFLMESGLPASAIPICKEEVTACPNGMPPASASPEYLAAREGGVVPSPAAPATTGAGMAGTGMSFLRKDRRGYKRKFGGALMTSGSFTMMASTSGM